MLDLVQTLADGLLFGAIYALIGIGFTLVFGVMHKLNMAYAAASLAGAYAGVVLLRLLALHPWLVIPLACAAGAVFGLVIYWLCFKFIPLSHPLATLMSTVGMLLLIDEMVVHATAGMPVSYPTLVRGMVRMGEFSLRGDLIVCFLVAVAAMGALLHLLYRTRLGLATRAVSQQPVAAQLCGMSLGQVNAATFTITGSLGGIAGALIGSAVGMLSPLIVAPLTVKGLIVTVIGGLGSIPGAIVAGLLVGAAENLFQFLRGVTERDIYVMLLLFVFLVFRPGGILGRDPAES
ncbi:MAG TPA: branched-chain amino acid ABC transporter permease [Hyphomicrobiaceae bacterium]|jgi:branched-chain amino acid transport system permease protein|nr:branched-chain amino acid ABC transporter permease [Hyphomicrobiaceae bacterium]